MSEANIIMRVKRQHLRTVLLLLLLLALVGCSEESRKTAQNIKSAVQRSLLEACESGSVEDVKKQLPNVADVNAIIHDDTTYAQITRSSDVQEANYEAAKEGRPPIPDASAAENTLLSATLLRCNDSNQTLQKVQLLLQKGADVNKRAIQNGDTPLLIAMRQCFSGGSIGVPKLLVEAGADVNAKGRVLGIGLERTPLMSLAGTHMVGEQGVDVKIAQILMDAGAKIDLTNDLGETALIRLARRLGDGKAATDMLKFLIGHGADVNAHDLAGNTPLKLVQSAALAKMPLRKSELTAIVSRLKKAGARD